MFWVLSDVYLYKLLWGNFKMVKSPKWSWYQNSLQYLQNKMLFFFSEWLISFMCCYNKNKLTDNGHICMLLPECRPSSGTEKRCFRSLWLTSSSDCQIHTVKPLQKLVLVSWDQDKEIRIWWTSCISNFLLSSLSQHSLNFIVIPHRRCPLFSMPGDILHSFRFLVLKKKYKMIGLLASPVVNEASHWWEHIHNYVFCPFKKKKKEDPRNSRTDADEK